MYKVEQGKGEIVQVKCIEPSILKTMDKDDVIIVNRIRLNSKLVEYEIKNSNFDEVVIIQKAIQTMKSRENKTRKAMMGAEMKVSDVLQVFKNLDKLPKNSFAEAKL